MACAVPEAVDSEMSGEKNAKPVRISAKAVGSDADAAGSAIAAIRRGSIFVRSERTFTRTRTCGRRPRRREHWAEYPQAQAPAFVHSRPRRLSAVSWLEPWEGSGTASPHQRFRQEIRGLLRR